MDNGISMQREHVGLMGFSVVSMVWKCLLLSNYILGQKSLSVARRCLLLEGVRCIEMSVNRNFIVFFIDPMC